MGRNTTAHSCKIQSAMTRKKKKSSQRQMSQQSRTWDRSENEKQVMVPTGKCKKIFITGDIQPGAPEFGYTRKTEVPRISGYCKQ